MDGIDDEDNDEGPVTRTRALLFTGALTRDVVFAAEFQSSRTESSTPSVTSRFDIFLGSFPCIPLVAALVVYVICADAIEVN